MPDSASRSQAAPIVIIGAGLAGLTCARHLHAAGRAVSVLEADDAVGGRVRTDVIDGFRVDRGFQVYLTSYPEGRRVLDSTALEFGEFMAGADVRLDDAVHRVLDPIRHPMSAFRSMRAPIFSWRDAWRAARLRRILQTTGVDANGTDHRTGPTRDFLTEVGFSDNAIERFFRPFFSGVFLERDLTTPTSMFAFVYRMFSEGRAVLPAGGMQAIPEQLAAGLPAGAVRLRTRVHSVEEGRVHLADGSTLDASTIVIATDPTAAAGLASTLRPLSWRGCVSIAFAADNPPYDDPILMLDGSSERDTQTNTSGPINQVAVLSNVQPTYAPPGAALISATALGVPDMTEAALVEAARSQLRHWFGDSVNGWRHLISHAVPHALPMLVDKNPSRDRERYTVARGLIRTGDYLENASINGALVAGRRAAEVVLRQAATGTTDT